MKTEKEIKELPDDEKKNLAVGAKMGNRPAFPSDFNYGDKDFTGMPIIVHRTSFGLTKREYFAGLAMQGMLANATAANPTKNNEPTAVVLSKAAIVIADELLKQLEQ